MTLPISTGSRLITWFRSTGEVLGLLQISSTLDTVTGSGDFLQADGTRTGAGGVVLLDFLHDALVPFQAAFQVVQLHAGVAAHEHVLLPPLRLALGQVLAQLFQQGQGPLGRRSLRRGLLRWGLLP